MRNQFTRFTTWFEKRGRREPKLEPKLLRAARAFDSAYETGVLSSKALKIIVDAASSPYALVWQNAVGLLEMLSWHWPEAREAIFEMFESQRQSVRFAALCCLGKKSHKKMTDAILRGALRDKSSRVRWKSAELAYRFRKRKLLADMEAALIRETNPKARSSIESSVRLLRDGYIIGPEEAGELVSITVRGKRSLCMARFFPVAYLKTAGIAKIVQEMLADEI